MTRRAAAWSSTARHTRHGARRRTCSGSSGQRVGRTTPGRRSRTRRTSWAGVPSPRHAGRPAYGPSISASGVSRGPTCSRLPSSWRVTGSGSTTSAAAVVAREMGTLRQDPRQPVSTTPTVSPAASDRWTGVTRGEPGARDDAGGGRAGGTAGARAGADRRRDHPDRPGPGGVLDHDDLSDANAESVIGSVRPLARLPGPRHPRLAATLRRRDGGADPRDPRRRGPPVGPRHPSSATCASPVRRSSRSGGRLTTMSGSDDERTLAGLLSPDRLRATAASLDVEMDRPDAPSAGHHPSTATTCFAIADGEGGIVALTTTLLSFFGSQVGVEGCGFHLNNAMLYFDPRPGTPNSNRTAQAGARGGRTAHRGQPGRLATDGHRRAGARRIISATAQAVENRVDHRLRASRGHRPAAGPCRHGRGPRRRAAPVRGRRRHRAARLAGPPGALRPDDRGDGAAHGGGDGQP